MLAQTRAHRSVRIPQRETIGHCPFCSNDEIMVVLYESESVRIFPDIRPIIGGHFLIATATHYQSMEDQEPLNYWRVRVAQQELARRVRAGWGGIASCYEHGRSAICRFHAADRGDTHAHVHVLPTQIDVFERSQTAERSPQRPVLHQLRGTDRYIYQSLGDGAQWWGWRPKSVPRHFLRVALQAGLEEQGQQYIPLDAPQTDHIATVEQSAAIYREHRDIQSRVLRLSGPSRPMRTACAVELAAAWDAALIDSSSLLRLLAADTDLGDEVAVHTRLAALEQELAEGTLGWSVRDDQLVLERASTPVPGGDGPEPCSASGASPEAIARARDAVWRLVQRRAEHRRIVVTGSSTDDDTVELEFGTEGARADRALHFSAEHLSPAEAAHVALEALQLRTT